MGEELWRVWFMCHPGWHWINPHAPHTPHVQVCLGPQQAPMFGAHALRLASGVVDSAGQWGSPAASLTIYVSI